MNEQNLNNNDENMGELFKQATEFVKEMNPNKLKEHRSPMDRARYLMEQLDIIKQKIIKINIENPDEDTSKKLENLLNSN